MKSFVTGATGFIGRRLIERLKYKGFEIIALVRNEGHGLPKGVKAVYGDILNPDSLEKSGKGCNRLYHLAGMISFDPRKRKELLQVNGNGTANILAAARRWNVERSVVVSSACTIGLSYVNNELLDENTPFKSRLAEANPYLESKLLAEKAAINAAKNQTVVIVNPTTVYGPGDWSLNSGTLVSKIVKSSIIPVPPGGSNVVDVDDVIEGIIAAGEGGHSGSRYILGGENMTFAQIFSTIADVVGHRPLFVPIPRWMRASMATGGWFMGRLTGNRFITSQIINDMFGYKYFSNEMAKKELGWMPRYNFGESVERAWEYYKLEGLM